MVALYEELGSYRAVAEIAGCDHKTVKRYVEFAGERGQHAPERHRARVTDDYRALIRDLHQDGIARAAQRPPAGDWYIWELIGARGSG
jgi:hypothetical protein